MDLPRLHQAYMVRRYKRFLVDVVDDYGSSFTIYCPNTGSMKNCVGQGWRVWYSWQPRAHRKYSGTLEYVESPHGVIGVNTQRANALVAEALNHELIKELGDIDRWQSEVRIDSGSRMDFWYQTRSGNQGYIEVKSVTLREADGYGYFPDAVSRRGSQHLQALITLKQQGYDAALVYCVQHSGIHSVRAAEHIDARYAQLLRKARQAGVKVLAYGCYNMSDAVSLAHSIAVSI